MGVTETDNYSYGSYYFQKVVLIKLLVLLDIVKLSLV